MTGNKTMMDNVGYPRSDGSEGIVHVEITTETDQITTHHMKACMINYKKLGLKCSNCPTCTCFAKYEFMLILPFNNNSKFEIEKIREIKAEFYNHEKKKLKELKLVNELVEPEQLTHQFLPCSMEDKRTIKISKSKSLIYVSNYSKVIKRVISKDQLGQHLFGIGDQGSSKASRAKFVKLKFSTHQNGHDILEICDDESVALYPCGILLHKNPNDSTYEVIGSYSIKQDGKITFKLIMDKAQADGNTSTSEVGGNTSTAQADGNTSTSEVGGNTSTAQADGNTSTSEVAGVGGNPLTAGVGGNPLTGEVGGNTLTAFKSSTSAETQVYQKLQELQKILKELKSPMDRLLEGKPVIKKTEEILEEVNYAQDIITSLKNMKALDLRLTSSLDVEMKQLKELKERLQDQIRIFHSNAEAEDQFGKFHLLEILDAAKIRKECLALIKETPLSSDNQQLFVVEKINSVFLRVISKIEDSSKRRHNVQMNECPEFLDS
ncbi:hypothetical protein AC249_AIPGENE12886 [Exaiptasia diaphana]|nr:hypothetical protein AC249_AIPGENE12886 [Exaiptasia diaphana]